MASKVKYLYMNDMKVETVKVKYEPHKPQPLWPQWLTFFGKKKVVTPERVVWEEAFPWP
jgi:hypothetical protein